MALTVPTFTSVSQLNSDPNQIINAVYTVSSTSGDTLALPTVPKGRTVHSITVSVPGVASSTLSVGDATSATRFLNAVSTASAGTVAANVAVTISSGAVATGLGYKYTADTALVATLGGANVAGTYRFTIHLLEDFNG